MPDLSKSRFLKGRQCRRRLWLAAHRVEEPQLESDEVWEEREAEGAEVERQVATLYPNAVRILEAPEEEAVGEGRADLAQSIERTTQDMTGDRPLIQAHLATDDLLAIVDLLEPRDGGWFLWEIKASTSLKPVFDWDLAFQCEVAKCGGLSIVGAGVIHLDAHYRRGATLDVERLIIREDRSERVAELTDEVRREIESQLRIMNEEETPHVVPGPRCKANTKAKKGDRPSACGHLAPGGHCAAELPPNWAGRLPRLSGAKAKYVASMAEPAIEHLDLDDEDRKWTPDQRRMIEAVQSGSPVVDRAALQANLDELRWPVAYVDFEFDPGMAVPRFESSRPYERIPFQWSMQIQPAPGEDLHQPPPFLHLGTEDPRRSFLDSLLDALPDVGSIVAHHQSAELTVLDQLADSLGEPYRTRITALSPRFFDTEDLLRAGYYHPAQQGSYSIKKVAPALLGEGYGDLEIQDGMAAVIAWRRASLPDCPGDEREAVRRDLLAYCGRDTQLMHDINEELRRLSVGREGDQHEH